MLVWFFTLAALGIWHIAELPSILQALSPYWAFHFFVRHGTHGFLILGSVVLVVTGGEALYADLGHFGIAPIRRAWLWLVLPALLIGYMGQGALVLTHPKAVDNPFFAQVPTGASTIALVLLSSAATIIASQALISGAFSLTRQAMVLGFFPNVTIHHTSEQTEGQIYIPEINILLAIGCLALVLTFRESVKLAAAYGIAVTGTMAITSVLFFIVARYAGMGRLESRRGSAFFLSFDIPFLTANLFKFFQGGYVPVMIGASLIAAMLIWNRGRTNLEQKYATQFPSSNGPRADQTLPLHARPRYRRLHRLQPRPRSAHPRPLCRTLPLAPRVRRTPHRDHTTNAPTSPSPSAAPSRTWATASGKSGSASDLWSTPAWPTRLTTSSGRANFPSIGKELTYYVGHETLTATRSTKIGRAAETIFAYLQRNAVDVESTFCLPPRQVIEIGTQVDV